jgi:hypothetical protein
LRAGIPDSRATSWIVSSERTNLLTVLWFVTMLAGSKTLPFGAYGEPM